MPINTSTYQADPPDAQGRYQVVERHTDHLGREHMIIYTCEPTWMPEEIMIARAMKLGAEIDRREQQEAEANNFTVPWTKLDFLKRMAVAERVACRTLAATDLIAADFMHLLDLATSIHPGDADLVAGLNYMESKGCFAAGRANEIAGAS